jgi:hypothetical protein
MQSAPTRLAADTIRVLDTIRTTVVDTHHVSVVDTVGVVMPSGDSTSSVNLFLTFGLLVFAGMQWWVTRQSESARQLERQNDVADRKASADRAADLAFQIVWAEHFRIQSLAERWASEDLVQLAALGVLKGDALLPRDWSTIVRSLATISQEAGYLGGIALTLAHDSEVKVAELVAVIRSCEVQYPAAPPVKIAQIVRDNASQLTDPLVTAIRHTSRDLAWLLWDAARQTPRAELLRELRFSDNMHSEFGRHMVAQLEVRSSQVGKDVA